MADQFKEYSGSDKAAIIEGLRSKFIGFNLKEVVLIAAAVGLFVLVVILGAVVGVETVKASTAEAQVAQLQAVCQDKTCLEAAAWSLANLNSSVAPCQDFYQYACGGYKLVRPLDADTPYHSVLRDMYEENQKKLVYLLESPVRQQDWASEKKLKDLFMSCIDDFTREQKGGKPLVDVINTRLGGWSVLGTWNPSDWNFNAKLKVVQDDFWTPAFWDYRVSYDWYNRGKYALGIIPAGTGYYMRWKYYLDPSTQKVRDDYKNFMRRVAQLLQRDAKVNMTDDDKARKVEEFVSDAFDVEKNMAQILINSTYLPSASAPENRITLRDLTTQTSNVIDFVEMVTYMFGGDAVTADTPVIVYYFNSLKNVTQMISHLPAENKTRMLHNYMVWRVVEMYAQDLSWEYVHAIREVYADIYGRVNFPGTWLSCFNWISWQMREALGALFIMDHFADKNKDKVTEITEKLKLALEDSISSSPWMDSATKKLALAKAKAVTYKLGYPDDLVNQRLVDAIYISLAINRTDYLGNVRALYQFRKEDHKRMLTIGEDRNYWYFSTFDTSLSIFFFWNEIAVPAGLLQFPLYQYTLPHYMTFGSFGSITAHYITHVVDEWGRYWDEAGMYLGANNWWSNATRDAFKSVRQCIVDFYTNKTQGPFPSPDGGSVKYPIDAERTATENLAMTSGVRLAYKAFKMWEKQYGVEKNAPGLGLTNDQTFFLSFAQSYCSNRDEATLMRRAFSGRINDNPQINMVLQQLKEFSTAFSCPAGSPMNPAQKCQLY